MIKRLTAIGNSLGLIIERPILELLEIDTPSWAPAAALAVGAEGLVGALRTSKRLTSRVGTPAAATSSARLVPPTRPTFRRRSSAGRVWRSRGVAGMEARLAGGEPGARVTAWGGSSARGSSRLSLTTSASRTRPSIVTDSTTHDGVASEPASAVRTVIAMSAVETSAE